MLAHYGDRQGVRVARKHLGWYLDRLRPSAPRGAPRRAAAEPTIPRVVSAAPDAAFDAARRRSGCGMNMAAANPPFAGVANAVLNALPHPVVMIGPDGRIVGANQAAEDFFESSASGARAATISTISSRSAARSSA